MNKLTRIIAPLCLVTLSALGATTAFAHHDGAALKIEKEGRQDELTSMKYLKIASGDTDVYTALTDMQKALTPGVGADNDCWDAVKVTKDTNARSDLSSAIYMFNSSNGALRYGLKHDKTMKDIRYHVQEAMKFASLGENELDLAIKSSGK